MEQTLPLSEMTVPRSMVARYLSILQVMCMSPDANGKGREMEMRAEEFFEHFEANGMPGEEKGGPHIMLKLKDFPPDGSFSQHLGRHAQVGQKSRAGCIMFVRKASRGKATFNHQPPAAPGAPRSGRLARKI